MKNSFYPFFSSVSLLSGKENRAKERKRRSLYDKRISENSLRNSSGREILMLIRAVGGRSRILPIESQQGIDTKIPGQEHLSSPGKGGIIRS